MRWPFLRDPGTCAGCGAGLQRGATWCGSCGARVEVGGEGAPGDGSDHDPDGDRDVADAHDSPVRRRALAAAAGAVLAALVAATVLRPPPPVPLLGEVGSDTGVTATAAPPVGLRVAWERRLGSDPFAPGGTVSSFDLSSVAADGGRVRVDGTVVELDTGRVVAVSPWLSLGGGVLGAWLRDDSLVTVDTLTGEVVGRAERPAVLGDRSDGASLVADDVAVFETDDGSALVTLDGAVVAEVEGRHVAFLDGARSAPAAVPLRRVDLRTSFFEDVAMLPVRLVSTSTGEEVFASGDEARVRVAEVVGDVAIVAETGGVLGDPGPSGATWQVLVLDARTGQLRQRVSTSSAEPPRLVGVTRDGTAVLGSRTGSAVELTAVSSQGRVAPLGTTTAGGSVGDLFEDRTGRIAVVDGDVVVVLRDGEAVATGLDGTVRWRAGSGAEELAAGDGYVALLGPTTVRVVHSGDGATVASLPRSALFAQGPTLLGVVDGSVGIALGGSPQSSTQLGSTTWLDLGDGEQDPIDELFASSREEPPRTAMVNWLFHGTTSPVDDGDVTVGGVPVVTSSDGRSSLRVRDAEGELRSVTLPTPDPTGPVADLGEVTGAAPGRLAVTQYRFSDENDHDVVTHLLDIEDGSRRTITGWAGMLLTDRFLLAAEQGPGVEEPRVAVFDPATGEQRWVASRPELFGRPRHDASLLVAADVLGATTLLLDDGTVPWRHVGSSVLADLRPVLGARRVLLATAGGEVVALDRADGGELWRTDVGAPITAITGAGQDTLVGTREGLVVHLGADGRERQRIAVATSPVVDVAALGTTTVAVTDDAVIGLRVDGDGLVTDDEVDLP